MSESERPAAPAQRSTPAPPPPPPAPPAPPPPAYSPPASTAPSVKSLRGLALAIVGLLVVGVLLAAASLTITAGLGGYLPGRPLGQGVVMLGGTSLGIEVVLLALYFATGIVFVAWLHRAYVNLAELGIDDLRHSRGWVIGAWFVPFLNLVRPFQIVQDVTRASAWARLPEARTWRAVAAPGIVAAWWALFLLRSVLDGVAGAMASGPSPGSSMVLALLVAAVVEVGAAGLLAWVVLRVTADQALLAEERHGVVTPSVSRPGGRLVGGLAGAVAFGLAAGALVTVPTLQGEDVLLERAPDGSVVTAGLTFWDELRTGDCYDETTVDGWYLPEVVGCDGPHAYEVAARRMFPMGRGAAFPGDDEVYELGYDLCRGPHDEALASATARSEFDLLVSAPDEINWAEGDRLVLCIVATPHLAGLVG